MKVAPTHPMMKMKPRPLTGDGRCARANSLSQNKLLYKTVLFTQNRSKIVSFYRQISLLFSAVGICFLNGREKERDFNSRRVSEFR